MKFQATKNSMSLTIRFIPVQATPPPQATLKLAYVKGRQPATEHHLNTQSSNAPASARRGANPIPLRRLSWD